MIKESEPHIIQKQSIEINFEEMDAAVGVQHRVAELFYERLQPEMEKLFDEMVGNDHSAIIEYLEIDCGVLEAKNWESEWLEQVIRKLRAQLREVNKSPVDKRNKAVEIFFFFLKQGTLPWNSFYKSIRELEDLIVVDNLFITRLKEAVQSSRAAEKRLLWQFSKQFKQRLIDEIQIEAGYSVHEKNQEVESVLTEYPHDTDKQLIKLMRVKKEETESYQQKESAKGKIAVKVKAEQDIADTIYINNAGLILLHPFLAILFSKLNLTRDDNWIDENAQHRAMLVLQFLVNAESVFPEYELPLNKILCDWPLNEGFDTNLEIDAFTRIACEELLEEVIQYWTRLKNTGIDALRETFLRRLGKLTRVNNGWLLQVEQKSFDVLLGGLPWSINVVKLPWMKEILYVEWT